MKVKTAFLAIAIATGTICFLGAATAATISSAGHSVSHVAQDCAASGGMFGPPTLGNHEVWSCLNPDGSGIACGGVGDRTPALAALGEGRR
jgi:hypothetical protein